jgi:serine protease Do
MKNLRGLLDKSSLGGLRLKAAVLVLAGAIGLWQAGPLATVEAKTPVDLQVAVTGAPPGFAEVIEAVKPSVVNISVKQEMAGRFAAPAPGMPFPPGSPFEDFLRRFFERQSHPGYQGQAQVVQGMGSGFIVDPDGYVVTNNHVIEGAEEITVTLDDGSHHTAELLGSDPKTDLALLKIEAGGPLPYARFGDSDVARVGDWVIAIGNPFGLGGTATTGIVSARGRDIQSGPFDDFLQIDAPINRGNSGGPLFDTSGRVIGINTAIFSPNGGSVGIGFAIPAKQAEPVIHQIRTLGHVERGWLGVQIQAVDEEIAAGLGLDDARGALVANVVSDSPADEAGLKPGDVILRLNAVEVEHLKDLTRAVAELSPRTEAEVEVWRGGGHQTLDVVLGETPESVTQAGVNTPESNTKPTGKLGLSLARLTPESRERYGVSDEVEGALIVGIEPNSPAASRGLRPGDVVIMVGQTPVSDPSEAVREIQSASRQERTSVLLQVTRGGERRFVAIPFA